MLRVQFWALMRWVGIQSNYGPVRMRQMRETLEANGSIIEAFLADGQVQSAIDLMRKLGALVNPERPVLDAVTQADYQTGPSAAFTDPGAADEYALFRAPAAAADDWSAFEEVARGVASPLVDPTFDIETEYAYRVVSYDLVGETTSLPSNAEIITTASIPLVADAAASAVAAPVITWTSITPAPASENVYRDGGLIGEGVASGYADATAVPSTEYSYTVRSVFDGNESGDSNAAVVTTPI